MRFTVPGPLKDNIYNAMRDAGYHFWGRDEKIGELSFARPLHEYPRFHIYLKTEGQNLFFNLHLDQKKPIYKGTAAHSGEYDGEVVEKEAERIKQFLMKNSN